MNDSERTCPDRGHLVWVSLDPQSGHEQAGRRPALILSPASYNGPVGLALFCPVTTQAKGYPFEVPLPTGLPISGVVLADHVKCLDWRSRRAEYAGNIPESVVAEVVRRLGLLLGIPSAIQDSLAESAETPPTMTPPEKLTAILAAVQIDPGKRGLAQLFAACPGDFAAACWSITNTITGAVDTDTGFFIPTAYPHKTARQNRKKCHMPSSPSALREASSVNRLFENRKHGIEDGRPRFSDKYLT